MKMLFQSLSLFTWVFLFSMGVSAAPLGEIPDIEAQFLRIIFDFRSDIWTAPYTYKDSPVRLIDGEIRIPIIRAEDWSISANVSDESLSLGKTEFSLVDRQIFIGSNLHSTIAGLGFNGRIGNEGAISVIGSYASASDNPFDADGRNTWFEGSVTYLSEPFWNYRWIMAVDHSANRGIANNRIFPYVGIIFEAHRDIVAAVGFPFMRVIWQKKGEWRREAQVTPFGATFLFEKDLLEDFVYHSHLNYSIRSYLPGERINQEDRLYYQEMSFESSFRKNLSDFTTVTFGLGYAFDRHLYESRSLYEARQNKTDIDADMYGRIRMELNLW